MSSSHARSFHRSQKLCYSAVHAFGRTPPVSTGLKQSKRRYAPKRETAPRERERKVDGERDIFLSVLSASTTKRDAKAYISRFSPKASDANGSASSPPRHVALVKLRALETVDDFVIDGLGRTFSQLSRLGLSCVVIVEAQHDPSLNLRTGTAQRLTASRQADRLVSALEKAKSVEARRLDDLLGISASSKAPSPTVRVRGQVEVQYSELLSRTLSRGLIPIISPLAFTEETQRLTDVKADDAILAIVRELAGVRKPVPLAYEDAQLPSSRAESTSTLATDYHVDRLVIIDPVGALPSANRLDNTHIFLNMEQEYEDTRAELLQASQTSQSSEQTKQHVANLDLLRNALVLLPPSSSALLTTPRQAATMIRPESETDALGVQTRRPKNPLIFNLLTDKPLISSSLPAGRMSSGGDSSSPIPSISPQATFAKRGMPLTIIPNAKKHAWQRPKAEDYHMNLQDPRIDFPRLLTLIEDSFNRPLDVAHYLERIRGKIAGVIVAGEYEGGAILTWELPPGVADDGSESSRQRMVPYLDKFAVLKRSQGAGGVADIVFSAMVRTCFPDGVCWRSRRDNPVNKWYFERAVGTWKIPESSWTMFWTDKQLEQDSQQWRDYEAVCRTVAPSWADNKHKAD